MSTQILILAEDAGKLPFASEQGEAKWSPPKLQIVDLRLEYAHAPLDVARERRRLKGIDTVLLQLTENTVLCPLLAAWMQKVLALDGVVEDPEESPSIVRRVGAIVVRAACSAGQYRASGSAPTRQTLKRLERAVESVGIEWLTPLYLEARPDEGAEKTEALNVTHRRAPGRLDAGSRRADRGARGPHALGRRVVVASAVLAMGCVFADIGLSICFGPSSEAGAAWSELVTAWLAVSLATLASSILVNQLSGAARLLIGLAAAVFVFQRLSAWVPDADVLRTVPVGLISGALTMLLALVLLETCRPIQRFRLLPMRRAVQGR